MITTFFCLVAALAAPSTSLVVAPLARGDGTTDGMVKMLGETFAAELRRQSTYQVLTYAELESLLSHEQTKDLLGCTDASCFAEIGAAAGAQALATGSVGKVGKSWVVALKLIDANEARVLASADRRIQSGASEDLLDLIGPMVSELVEKAKSPSRASSKRPQPRAAVRGSAPPPAFVDESFSDPAVTQKLSWLTDGKGHFLGYDPEELYRGPVFAGTSKRLYSQRVIGGGKSGAAKWSFVFWEPRVTQRWRGGFKADEGTFELQCGEQAIRYAPVNPKKAKRLSRKVELFAPRWQRTAILIARDDRGTYYYVDQAREPRGNSDYRLFVGPRGKVAHIQLDDAIIDSSSSLYISSQGRLIVRSKDGKKEAQWAVGDTEKPLTLLNLYQQAPMIYTTLGAYEGQALGTPCDPHLGGG